MCVMAVYKRIMDIIRERTVVFRLKSKVASVGMNIQGLKLNYS